jgi:hypothetical protein
MKERRLGRRAAPYLVAGAGSMLIDQGSGREAHLLFSGGAGLTYEITQRWRPFVELRWQRAMTGVPNSFLPVSFGVAF